MPASVVQVKGMGLSSCAINVTCLCLLPSCTADRLTAWSHQTPLTLCSASRSTHTHQRKEAGDAVRVFSAFPPPHTPLLFFFPAVDAPFDNPDRAIFKTFATFILRCIFSSLVISGLNLSSSVLQIPTEPCIPHIPISAFVWS